MDQSYWQKQEPGKLLFPDIEWSKPEQKSARGKLLIVGGSAHGFSSVGKAYATALSIGAGDIHVALPDALKDKLPSGINGIFLPTNISGGISKSGLEDLTVATNWSNGALLIGDFGQNSETAALLNEIIINAPKSHWLTIARDAVDLVIDLGEELANRPNTNLVMSFAQTQKLFSKVFYPKVLTFSMQFTSLIDALHKFTTTYQVTITMVHEDHLILASNGEVVTQKDADVIELIDGTIAAKSSCYLLWSQDQPIEAIATSWQS